MHEVRPRVGAMHQVMRIDRFVEDDGPARGARRLRMINGGGLEIDVHPDRGLDIGQVTVDGMPVAWISPVGVTAPHFYEPEGRGWLRTFTGGLLATCGLDTFGPPSTDGGASFGLHGRIGTTPALLTAVETTSDGVVVRGEVRQASVFGEHLVLRRQISSQAGSDSIVVEDTVTNEGFEDCPFMLMYHVNLGWPLLDDTSMIDIPSVHVRPRDADAEDGITTLLEFPAPMANMREQVFHHAFAEGDDPQVRVTNPANGLSFAMTFSRDTLPYMVQWKMPGEGHYVLGVEPVNCDSLAGRAQARAEGLVTSLAPGASASMRVAFHLRRQLP